MGYKREKMLAAIQFFGHELHEFLSQTFLPQIALISQIL
jgi:hypothetical protein